MRKASWRRGEIKTTSARRGEGIRVSQSENGALTVFHIDPYNHTGYAQVLEEGNAAYYAPVERLEVSEVSLSYTIGLDVFEQRGSSAISSRFYLYDGHGSTRALMNFAATVLQRYAYDAYGVQLVFGNLTGAANASTRYLYSGERTDKSTGWQNLQVRYLDPQTGRFITLDPADGYSDDPQTLHKYLYVHGDPVNFNDPSGMFEGLSGLVTGISARLHVATAQVGAVFSAAAAAGRRVDWAAFWRAIVNLGAQTEKAFAEIVNFASTRLSSTVEILRGAITAPGFRNSFDGVVRIGQRVMSVEVKSTIEAIPRVVTQLSRQVDSFSRLATEIGVPRIHGHLVWTWNAPSLGTLNKLLTELGPDRFNQIQFVHGVEGLVNYFKFIGGG